MYPLIRPLLFQLDPETAHHVTLTSLRLAQRLGIPVAPKPAENPVKVMGLTFPNPVGLAAGLDKNGEYIDALAALGFGFLEIGTVTPRPQPGNPKPRLFRLPAAQAIINRMGFNNQGMAYLLEQVKNANYRGILGINIGKNATTPIQNAAEDYQTALTAVYPHASYVTINISSPNTSHLRELQAGDAIGQLLAGLKATQTHLADQHGRYVPLAIKIAPDLDDNAIRHLADQLRLHRMDAVIATNTTLSRTGTDGLPHTEETGGLSGAPLTTLSTHVILQLAQALAGELPIIGAGGILSAHDAQEKQAAGAQLIQLYTGLIYRGPSLIKECSDALAGQP
jgi:dihydroorotate dehydrogenase